MRFWAFFIFPSNESGHSSNAPSLSTPCTAVHWHCNSHQTFALFVTAHHLQSPKARLGRRLVCTTSELAQKRDAEPVGGRGISAFSVRFLLWRPNFRCSSINLRYRVTFKKRRRHIWPSLMNGYESGDSLCPSC